MGAASTYVIGTDTGQSFSVEGRPRPNYRLVDAVPEESHSLVDFFVGLQPDKRFGKRHWFVCSLVSTGPRYASRRGLVVPSRAW